MTKVKANHMSINEFISFLEQRKKHTPLIAEMKTRTIPKLLKFSRENGDECPWPLGLEKICTRSVCLGCIYAKEVNKQRNVEHHKGIFVPEGLWVSSTYPDGAGERDGPYTVVHKGSKKRYFAIRPLTDDDNQPITHSEVWIDLETGIEVDKDAPVEYLPVPHTSKRQEVERPVHWRCIEIGNVVSVFTLGTMFEITH